MAMVLDAFACYVGHMLAQVAADEVGTMFGLSGKIDKMGDKLRDLKNFLADADKRNITDETVQEWVGQLKRAMYEATDILDLCQLKAMGHGPSTVNAGCFNPLLFCMRNPFHAHEIGTRIKALNQRLDSIKERSATFGFINIGSYKDHSSNENASCHGNAGRETSGELDRSGVVGDQIEQDTRALVAQIMLKRMDVKENIIVVAIVGVGGVGKTTLAQKVFNHEAIKDEFKKKMWLSVNQNFSEVEMLKRAIIEAGGDTQLGGNAITTLHRSLKDVLNGHKTLLVMDDVWHHGAWEDVLKVPLLNAVASGSRVLITTRDEGVARGMKATCPYHHVNTLAPDDAWSLLKKQVLSTQIDEDHINTLKDVGLKILQKCGGLPLAIKVIGGLLRIKGGLRCYWEKVLDDSKWSITKMPQELNHAVYLSYEDMPPYLKQCFMYYSLLPKHKMFDMHHIIALWISEGFIHGNSDDLEEFGRTYYDELISRNLIEPDERFTNQVFSSMHDVVRAFARYMSKDEALVAHDEEDTDIVTTLNSQKFLRLSIETSQLQSAVLDWKSLKEQKSVRTLISTMQITMKPGDSLAIFSSLRALYVEFADGSSLVKSLHKLKHLRYLGLTSTNISLLPENIGKMKLLQFLNLQCPKLVNLPGSIVKLAQLRLLNIPIISMIPRGFCGLTNMRKLCGFQAHMDDDWCSLNELGPLSQLRLLDLYQLENVSDASFAANARLYEKMHLSDLSLNCTSKLGHDGLVKEKAGVSQEEQQQIEKVFDELCPPPSAEIIHISGYFGYEFPTWMMSMSDVRMRDYFDQHPMMSTSRVPLNNLKFLFLSDLAFCTELPNGLCDLPYLQSLEVFRAPCIRLVETGFFLSVAPPFPRLNKMVFVGMVEWETWVWQEQVQAMCRLEKIELSHCKLRRFPPGLASHARALKQLILQHVQHLRYIENLPSVVEITVHASPHLEKITKLPNLEKLNISGCPSLKVLANIPALEKLVLADYTMEDLPDYMRDVTPKVFILFCRLWLLASVAAGQSGLEWDKFSHVEHVKAYALDRNNRGKWYVLYTRSDNKLDTNVCRSTVFEETLSSCMVGAQEFESVYKMKRNTFSYLCSLVRVPFLEDMIEMNHTFVDGRVMSLQDRVAVILRMLISGETPEIVGSSLGVSKLTVLLVTHKFFEVMCERTMHHIYLSDVEEMAKIKSKFDKIHSLPNCCGVVHSAHIWFGQDHEHEENDGMLMQAVIAPDMKFTDIWLGPSGSMNQLSILHDSKLFKFCEEGNLLNGPMLEVTSGGESVLVGEYIIGDEGYPLLPWLLTPYQIENDLPLSDSKVEFNRRHSEAATVALRALTRFKDTWRCLQKNGWNPKNEYDRFSTLSVCCMLHNIVIEMDEGGAILPRCPLADAGRRQLAGYEGAGVRDALSQCLFESQEYSLVDRDSVDGPCCIM